MAGRMEAARFAREARITSAVSNANLARVLDVGVDAASEAPYLVMELLSGEDLDAVLGRVGALSPTIAARILLSACVGIEAAHAAGIIHRDIKPSNIFLHRGEGDEIMIKICDFGLAKQLFADESMTKTGSVLGSPAYMSPEQSRNSKRVDGRTDVWSLGMTLYEMLSGGTAFRDAETIPALMVMISSKDVPSIQDRAPWVGEALTMVTHGALMRDLEARCPNVGALMDALRPLAGGSERIAQSMLVAPSNALRAKVSARARLPQSWSDVEQRVPSSPPPSHHESATVRLLGHTLGGRYLLQSVLGSGGMGAVYETRSASGERLAVKVILGDAGGRQPDVLRRFVREARAVMSITSDHVVKVVDADTDLTQQVPFIVMELLEGQDLAGLLQSAVAIEAGPVAYIFMQACRGLASAHALGIVHRDIKPANIFLHELPSGEIVTKICDFGVAKELETKDTDVTAMDLTRTGGFLGSPMYFSPEQARNAKNVDHRTDIWSLAITLYESLSGKRPWESCSSVGEIILAVCTQDVPPLTGAAPWISPALAAVVHKGLARDPSERYASMEEFAAALQPFANAAAPRRTTLIAITREKLALATTQAERVGGSTTAHANTVRESHAEPTKRKSPVRKFIAVGVLGAVIVSAVGGTVLVKSHRFVDASRPSASPPILPAPDAAGESLSAAVATASNPVASSIADAVSASLPTSLPIAIASAGTKPSAPLHPSTPRVNHPTPSSAITTVASARTTAPAPTTNGFSKNRTDN